jgi:hypothetical protein
MTDTLFLYMLRKSLYFIIPALILSSCDTGLQGDFKQNQPPKTYLTVNSINLPEGDRLNSQTRISWWGDDPDGYIVGYEIYIGDNAGDPSSQWTFTTSRDSTFILPIEEGNTVADVRLTIRAIDNDDAKDPQPPSLVFPIENSPPGITIVNSEAPPDSTFGVFSFGIRGTDPDGFGNLNRIELTFTPEISDSWISFDPNTQLITFIQNEENEFEIFTGKSLLPKDEFISDVITDRDISIYFRSFDNAGSVSDTVSYSWFFKQQKSKILFINDFSGPNSMTTSEFHIDILKNIGLEVIDYIDISDGSGLGGNRVPFSNALPNRSLVSPTINRMLAQWDHIYWVSDDLNRNIGYALELTFEFFQNGGTMFQT